MLPHLLISLTQWAWQSGLGSAGGERTGVSQGHWSWVAASSAGSSRSLGICASCPATAVSPSCQGLCRGASDGWAESKSLSNPEAVWFIITTNIAGPVTPRGQCPHSFQPSAWWPGEAGVGHGLWYHTLAVMINYPPKTCTPLSIVPPLRQGLYFPAPPVLCVVIWLLLTNEMHEKWCHFQAVGIKKHVPSLHTHSPTASQAGGPWSQGNSEATDWESLGPCGGRVSTNQDHQIALSENKNYLLLVKLLRSGDYLLQQSALFNWHTDKPESTAPLAT